MKLMIASDIHGSAYYCRKMIEAFEAEQADKLILLGDVLYHGPRNDLPRDYAPKEVIQMLNSMKEKILCVRGNCEAEVDQMVLEFPVLADYAAILVNGGGEGEMRTIYITHGHIYNEENLPPLAKGDLLVNGHTHLPALREHLGNDEAGYVYMNPGSVAIPKGDSTYSYMVFEDGRFAWKELETGKEYMKYAL